MIQLYGAVGSPFTLYWTRLEPSIIALHCIIPITIWFSTINTRCRCPLSTLNHRHIVDIFNNYWLRHWNYWSNRLSKALLRVFTLRHTRSFSLAVVSWPFWWSIILFGVPKFRWTHALFGSMPKTTSFNPNQSVFLR